VSRPKSAVVKSLDLDIDIADAFGSEISVNIDIGKGDIDLALPETGLKHSKHSCSFVFYEEVVHVRYEVFFHICFSGLE